RFGPDGKLYVSVGDATNHLAAQDLSMLNGKILRLNPDGTIPDDNPFPGSPIFLYGTRNVFGMDFLGNTLYFTDNGPVGHDEVNIGVAGGNFGWPYYAGNVSWADYEAGFAPTEEAIPEGNYIDSIIDFTPSVAPTGMAYYSGDKLGGRPYTRVVFLGSFLNYNLTALRLGEGGWYIEDVLRVGFPILGMIDGPDGHLYLSTFDKIVRVILV
ncbi:MAG: PQQ-dependent sugar dehydrogenase, partial [Nitrososphaerales archaeon]